MGSQGSSSNSAPVTAAQRLETYQAGQQAMAADTSKYGDSYKAPTYQPLNADYGKLQQDLTAGYTAPIDRQQTVALKENDQAMADRGIYSSLNALRANNDTRERFIPQFAAAGAQATNQRYALESADKAGLNAANQDAAKQTYESSWRPADYRAGMWNGTGGTISSGSSGGWSI